MERTGGGQADKAKESTLLEEWRPMSIDLVIVGPIEETMLDEDTCIEVKKTHWFLEHSQDRCGALDPIQAQS